MDYGTKRIGLALSDEIRLTAQPLNVVTPGELPESLRMLAREHEIDTVVVGLPTGLSGHEGDSAAGARRLASEIEEILGVDVILVDERFTSRMAENALIETGVRRRDRKETVDKVAAAIILQAYLDGAIEHGNS
ncbi:MAG: Holliday junction resolvase RuvX [Acidimicrobiia bacterium]